MIYLDNAATTLNKPRAVLREVNECLKKYSANPGRSSHKLSLKISEKIFETRERIATHLRYEKPENVIFFQNATHALNFAIKTSVKQGDHVLISDVEHNATARPVKALENKGLISYSVFESAGDLRSNIDKVVRRDTACIISSLHSNAFGRRISPKELIRISNEKKIPLIIDASQFLGHEELDVSCAENVTVCAPGHKALFGIQGSGFCLMTSNTVRETLVEGGSGNNSRDLFMPDTPPERYEAGTLASPAIISILKGIEFIENVSLDVILKKLNDLSLYTADCLSSVRKVSLYEFGSGIIPFNINGIPSEIVAYELGKLGICTRAGLQCAPLAHKAMGTYDTGTVRVSLSYFNKRSDISMLYKKLKYILSVY